jgi:2-methylcitrate dehydratase PrpD
MACQIQLGAASVCRACVDAGRALTLQTGCGTIVVSNLTPLTFDRKYALLRNQLASSQADHFLFRFFGGTKAELYIGDSWEILNLYFKPYAACRWGQPAVAGALSIIGKNEIDPDRIAKIQVDTFAEAARLPNGHPSTTEDAQYSLAYPVAAAILDGEVGPAQVLPPRLTDRRLLALLGRVTTVVSPTFDAAFPEKTIAEVTIIMPDGDTFRSGPVEAIWEPPDTLPGDHALEKKFLWLATPVVGEENAETLVNLILDFEQCQTIDPLLGRCVPDHGGGK